MTGPRFYITGSRLLTLEAFGFLLRNELRRAIRSQTFLTLLVLDVKRVQKGLTFVADEPTVREVAELLGREMRSTDMLGHTESDTLSLVLLEADFTQARSVVDRLVTRLESYDFSKPIHIVMGAACYPTHAVDAEGLRQEALSRPLVSWRPGTAPPL